MKENVFGGLTTKKKTNNIIRNGGWITRTNIDYTIKNETSLQNKKEKNRKKGGRQIIQINILRSTGKNGSEENL